MNYFNLIFSNKSILRIFQQEIFKRFKIEGEVIEFGASDEISKIKGIHSNKISNLLGYISKSEVIHKDDMVKVE